VLKGLASASAKADQEIKNMICEKSRDRLALALRRYVAGRISNDELDSIQVDWRDRGAVAVRQMAWGLYDDLWSHYAKGRHAINSNGRRTIAKWIVFLHSNNEYLWPDYSFIQIINWPLNLLTFGWWEHRKNVRRKEFEQAGDFTAWPFIATTDLDDAAQRPRYLVGHRRH
jgi:hypothetical protein